MNKSSRRKFIKQSLFAASGITLGSKSIFSYSFDKVKKIGIKKPNILLIMADDMGFSDLGCYGSEIPTPNIDRLANEGIRFTQFYNAARCCPSRASLLTGLYPHQVGMGGMVTKVPTKPGPYEGYLNDKCVTLAEVLKPAGYKTYMSGKWHVGELPPHWPMKRGFDKYYGLISGAMNYFDINKSKAPGLKRVFIKGDQLNNPPNKGFYVTDSFTDEAIHFLGEHNFDDPFFLYLAYTAPHWPLQAYPEDIAKYKGKYLKGWSVLREERYNREKEMNIINPNWKLSLQDPLAANWDKLENKERMDLKMAIYAAQIDRLDYNIGRVIKKLEDMKELDNTLIMFLSDNGACAEGGSLGFDGKNGLNGKLGTVNSYSSYGRSWANASNTPFRLYKHWVHEGGISTPFVVRYPKQIKHGQMTNQVGHEMDIMATLIEFSGGKYPTAFHGNKIIPLEGKSLLPIFFGKQRKPHEALYWEHMGNKAIRKGDWKLVSEVEGNWELYNMKTDRTETTNLVDKYPDSVDALCYDWYEWAKRVGVKL